MSKPPKFCYFFRLVLKKSNVWRVAVMVSERIANPSYRLFGSTSSILVPSARASLEPVTNPNKVYAAPPLFADEFW